MLVMVFPCRDVPLISLRMDVFGGAAFKAETTGFADNKEWVFCEFAESRERVKEGLRVISDDGVFKIEAGEVSAGSAGIDLDAVGVAPRLWFPVGNAVGGFPVFIGLRLGVELQTVPIFADRHESDACVGKFFGVDGFSGGIGDGVLGIVFFVSVAVVENTSFQCC